jgi:hypothetical protein
MAAGHSMARVCARAPPPACGEGGRSRPEFPIRRSRLCGRAGEPTCDGARARYMPSESGLEVASVRMRNCLPRWASMPRGCAPPRSDSGDVFAFTSSERCSGRTRRGRTVHEPIVLDEEEPATPPTTLTTTTKSPFYRQHHAAIPQLGHSRARMSMFALPHVRVHVRVPGYRACYGQVKKRTRERRPQAGLGTRWRCVLSIHEILHTKIIGLRNVLLRCCAQEEKMLICFL